MADCVVDIKNLGLSSCKDLPQLLRGMITTPRNFKLSAADALDSEAWQDALLADSGVRIHKWPDFKAFENASEEAIYEDTALSDLKVRDGKYRFRVSFVEALCNYLAMYTHNGSNQRVFFVDSENRIFGTTDADGNFKGFLVSLLNVEKLALSTGSEATKIPVYVVLTNAKELSQTGANVDGSFYDDLIELVDVDLTLVGSPTTSLIKVTVKTACDGVNVSGLVVGDFKFHKTDGTSVAITSISELAGVYSLNQSGALFVDGNVDLNTAALLTIPGYESTGPLLIDEP